MLQNHMRLCEVLNDSPIAIVLMTISKENWIKLYKCYFGDFIRSIHNVLHKFSDEEYEVFLIIYFCFHFIFLDTRKSS